MTIEIRESTKHDFQAIGKIFLEAASFHEQVDSIFTVASLAEQIFSEYMEKISYQSDVKIYVAIFNGEVIGYCVGQLIEKSPIFQVRKIGMIDNIAVKKDYKRQGVAKLLFNQIKAWFISHQVSHIELTAATNNAQSLGFWKKMGGKEFMKRIMIKL